MESGLLPAMPQGSANTERLRSATEKRSTAGVGFGLAKAAHAHTAGGSAASMSPTTGGATSAMRPAALAARLEPPVEEWPYLDEGTLLKTRSSRVCMTCHWFRHHAGVNCIPLLTCQLHQALIAHGEHPAAQGALGPAAGSRCPAPSGPASPPQPPALAGVIHQHHQQWHRQHPAQPRNRERCQLEHSRQGRHGDQGSGDQKFAADAQ
jgi:hypothetical protein